MTLAPVPGPSRPRPSAAGGPAAAAADPGWEARLAAWLSPIFESFDFCGITDKARAEGPAFPDHKVFLYVPGLAAAAVVPHLPTYLKEYGR